MTIEMYIYVLTFSGFFSDFFEHRYHKLFEGRQQHFACKLQATALLGREPDFFLLRCSTIDCLDGWNIIFF